MDENHQQATDNKLTITQDVKWVLSKKSKLLIPQGSKPTGFENKTRWDKLQLLAQVIGAFAIPLSIITLIISVWQFNAQQTYDSQKTYAQQTYDNQQAIVQRETELENLKDQQQQTTLETYLDRMQGLLSNDHLSDPSAPAEVRALARAQTFIALTELNSERKRVIVQFLYEATLIGTKPIIDLDGANLSGADLANTFLPNANLSGANLSGANLSNANLSGADLSGKTSLARNLPYISGAPYNNTPYTNLSGANLTGTNFASANLSGAEFSEAHFDCRNQSLSCINFFRANLSGTDFGCLGEFASPHCANLSNIDFGYANLVGANLSGANLSGADLSVARLGCALQDNEITVCSNLTEANLRGSHLDDANLSIIDAKIDQRLFPSKCTTSISHNTCTFLEGADLRDTSLCDANLSGVYLPGAKLQGAKFNCYANVASSTNFSNANLSNIDMTDDDLSNTNFTGTNLQGAILNGTILKNIKLKGADLSDAYLIGAKGITNKELESQAKSLKGATMHDGSIHP